MKKKFGTYTINVFDKKQRLNANGTIGLEVTLSGCIEIGLEIDQGTWRGDWLLRLFFRDQYSDYYFVSLENNDRWSNNPSLIEVNRVQATVRKRSNRFQEDDENDTQ